MSKQKKETGKSNLARNIIIFALGLAVALFVTGFLYINGILGKVNRTETRPTNVIAREDETFLAEGEEAQENTMVAEAVTFDLEAIQSVPIEGGVRNILLIGQDARSYDTERTRSDTMIICSIDPEQNKVVLTSLMRDMYVPIPGYSDNRINSAYMFGGMQLLDDTIEQDFGLHIDGNVEVNFDGFLEAVAVLGGIEIELTQEEADYLNNYDWSDQGVDNSSWNLTEGVNYLNPQQALGYSRMREIGNSDYDRTERQRKLIMAAFKKAKEGGLISMLGLANEIAPHLTTDMSNQELLSYVNTMSSVDTENVESYRLPVDGSFTDEIINEMAVLLPDLQMNNQYLHEVIYGSTETESEAEY